MRCSADLATGAAGLLMSLHFLSCATTGRTDRTDGRDASGETGLLELLTLG